MIERDNCLICGQDIYEPLLEEYNKRLEELTKFITERVKEAYNDPDAELFAKGLVEEIKYNF